MLKILMSKALSYVGQIVKDNDRDRFLLSLFAPTDRREDLWALFAFNYEIAKTREVVTEPQIGQARLQWWREKITAIYEQNEAQEHEVLKDLARAIVTHNLPREHFETLIDAREFDLADTMPSNMDGLLSYADYTSAPLMNLAVRISGGDPEYEPAQPVAVNYALMGILRAAAFHARQRRCYMPEDLMKKHGVTTPRLYDFLEPGEGLRAVAAQVSAQFVPNIRPRNEFLRAAQTLAGVYRGQIRRARYDLFSPRLSRPPAFKELRVWIGRFAVGLGMN